MENKELLKQLHIDESARATGVKPARVLAIGMLTVLIVAFGSWYWLAGGKVITVKTATAQALSAVRGSASVLDASGYVTARRQATVSAKVTGQVTEVLIEEGQRVKSGEVLARLDNSDATAQYDLAQAQLDAARAQLAGLRLLLTQARRDDVRQQDLLARKLTSKQAADDARTLVDTRNAAIATQQRQVEVAERSVEVAQVTLDNTVIRAPFSGVITVKAAQPGEIVSPFSAGGGYTRTGIGTIVDMDSLEIEVEVNEAFIGRVQADQPAQTTLNAYPDWKIPGKVIAIIPAADRSKATVKVRLSLDVKDSRIVPDMGARVAFFENSTATARPGAPGEAPTGVLIPANAIRTLGDSQQVFVVIDGQAAARQVKLGQNYSDLRQVTEGVNSGERVILAPPADLQDGDRVQTEQSG
ncbi:MAG: efflux RND transporter periplasmic adaptor subunit [Gammaproteobacteria bacterium]